MSKSIKTKHEAGMRRISRAVVAVLFLFVLTTCLYIVRLEAHTPADVFLPVDYLISTDDPENSDPAPSAIDTLYQEYARQNGRPYTIRQDILLSRLAYINAPQGFRGETPNVTLRDLCDEVERILNDTTEDTTQLLGRSRQEVLDITAGIKEHPVLAGLVICEYLENPSGLAGYVLAQNDEITMALRGTDDIIDTLDNVLLLPFNVSVQYADIRSLLAQYGEAKRIWLTGHSKGGHNAIYAASIDSRCRATGFNAPGFGIFLSDAQHDGLDAGVNYVINGDITGFLLFHMERRIVLESSDSQLDSRHLLDNFFAVDDLTISTRIQPLSVWSEWVTQIVWLALVFLSVYRVLKLLRNLYRFIRDGLRPAVGKPKG